MLGTVGRWVGISTRVSVETRGKKRKEKKKELGRDGDFGNTGLRSLG